MNMYNCLLGVRNDFLPIVPDLLSKIYTLKYIS